MGSIRVIVAEGPEGSSGPVGLLRAVLEQEGVDVAGEVSSPSELIQLAADEQPDAVVFAARAPQVELDRLRAVSPRTKVVFVSPILSAAEAEMAEAVVERADVLASLGPVLVHLCAPGRVNARRAITEHFDRPDWIDRVRKDPAALRDILSDGSPSDETEQPSVTSLQGEARAAGDGSDPSHPAKPVVFLPDLESDEAASTAKSLGSPPARRHRWRWPWMWTLGLVSVAVLVGTAPASITQGRRSVRPRS
jgi:chemotaxis response regulator CheB